MAKEVMKRSEVKKEDTWAIEDIYDSIKVWEANVEMAKQIAAKIDQKKEEMTSSPTKLLETLTLWVSCLEKLELTNSYAMLASDVDKKDAANQANYQKIEKICNDIYSRLSFVAPKILELEEAKLNEYFHQEPKLELFRGWIDEIKRTRKHRLNEEMEELLTSAGELQQLPAFIHSMFDNADIEFPEIIGEDGQAVRITDGRYVSFLMSSDRRVRKEAFLGLLKVYQKFQNTLAAVYGGQVKQLMFEAHARKYESTFAAALDANNVSPKVYQNLLAVVNENLDKMHRYVKLRKKCLGVDELHMYDIYAPMVADVEMKYTYEEAKKMVLTALAPLGEEYVKLLKEGFDNRWIDVYENDGKRSGAYNAHTYGTHPYVLLNYDGKLTDVFTLAHEMGHALHCYFTDKEQHFLYSGYKIFVAEVASTCNEVLLIKYLLANTSDKKEKAFLINHFLDSFKGTLYRQSMFAEFEKTTNEMAEAGESLTAEELKRVYYDLNCKYYGLDMVSDDEIAMEWGRIPHFYMNFYVYQYATGFSAAVAIASRILAEGEPAVADYLRFLAGGCSQSPVELLKIAGVDMTSKQPVQEALKVFGELLDEMEALTD